MFSNLYSFSATASVQLENCNTIKDEMPPPNVKFNLVVSYFFIYKIGEQQQKKNSL